MQNYRVKEGVVWCAGKRVPANRIVTLSPHEARHAPVEPLVEAPADRTGAAPTPERKAATKPGRRAPRSEGAK